VQEIIVMFEGPMGSGMTLSALTSSYYHRERLVYTDADSWNRIRDSMRDSENFDNFRFLMDAREKNIKNCELCSVCVQGCLE